jgi:23S rRNA pseudouridine2605 synthase
MHPRYGVEKTYHVQVAGKPTQEDLDRLLQGVWLSDGHVKALRVRRLKKSQGESEWLEIVLSEGKNREIRRMLAKLEHKVVRLRRVAIGPIQLDRLPRGKARRLRPNELARLQRASVHGPRKLQQAAGAVRPPKPTGEQKPLRRHSGSTDSKPSNAKPTGERKPRPRSLKPTAAKPTGARPRRRRP